MLLSCYFLTSNNPTQQTIKEQYFYNFKDVKMAYQQNLGSRHTFIWVRYDSKHEIETKKDTLLIKKEVDHRLLHFSNDLQIKTDLDGKPITKYLKTTVGRILLN